MKFFVTSVVMVALLTALCSSQPVDSSAPGLPNFSVNMRFKRQNVITGGHTDCRCAVDQVMLKAKCVTCEKYLDLTGDNCCPKHCPVNKDEKWC